MRKGENGDGIGRTWRGERQRVNEISVQYLLPVLDSSSIYKHTKHTTVKYCNVSTIITVSYTHLTLPTNREV